MEDINPTITVVPYPVRDGVVVNVIRDDLLPGGTKQRALEVFISNYLEYEHFVYAGPASGFAQVALTLACKRAGKRAVLFVVTSPRCEPALSNWCRDSGALLTTITNAKVSDAERAAQKYTERNSGKAILMPFGFDCLEYVHLLLQQLREAIPPEIKPKRLWLALGSGTLLRALAQIWPDTEFFPVRVGKSAWEDQYTPDVWSRLGRYERLTKLAAPQPFFAPVPQELLPPYPSVANYDAKVWQKVLLHAEDGDYIWNVAADKTS
jgi:hypothetical protein